jgi:hypothetical protein
MKLSCHLLDAEILIGYVWLTGLPVVQNDRDKYSQKSEINVPN